MERNGEVGEILSDAWEQYRREKLNALFQETKLALSVSFRSTFSNLCFEGGEDFNTVYFGLSFATY